jgi:cholesterol transport system auxiliary component
MALFCLVLLPACRRVPRCAAAPRPQVYDLGPGAVASPVADRMAALPVLVLTEVECTRPRWTAAPWCTAWPTATPSNCAPTRLARWSMPPAQLVRQRLREHLGQRRSRAASGARRGGGKPGLTLHLELDEFSHWFESPQRSSGLVRMRGTLAHTTGGVERLVAQRSFVMQQPATSADAAGGVRAMAAATDALIQEVDQWVQQVERAQEGK